jgi:quercetin dioxygenase-like cupin family protein
MKSFPALLPAALASLLCGLSTPALAAQALPADAPDRGVTTTPTPGFVQEPPTTTTPPSPPAPPALQPGLSTETPPHDHRYDDARHAMTVLGTESMQWSDAPPVLPRGAQVAILDGDPFAPGPFVLRLKMPPGYTIPPHWHSRAENITVISGALSLGMGDTVDPGAARTLTAGGFHAIPAEQHHFAFSKGGTVVQLHGEGPFDITYVNPQDNPEATLKRR